MVFTKIVRRKARMAVVSFIVGMTKAVTESRKYDQVYYKHCVSFTLVATMVVRYIVVSSSDLSSGMYCRVK
jgi:hypothetical protein